MSYRQRSIGKIGDFLPTVNLENLDETLAEIRQAAKEYYARKSGTWKPKRDLDAELLEDEARFRREAFMPVRWIGGYSSGPERVAIRPRVDPEKLERLRSVFEHFDMSAIEERIRDVLAKKMDLDRHIPEIPELKEYQHKFLYGEWVEPTVKIGEGKNPMAEHTIRAVKKSHAKRRFSKKSRRGIL